MRMKRSSRPPLTVLWNTSVGSATLVCGPFRDEVGKNCNDRISDRELHAVIARVRPSWA